MKYLTIVLITFLSVGIAKSQVSDSVSYKTKHTISIGLGIALPNGDFSETGNGEKDGYAMTGLSLNLDYAYNFHPNIAATFIVRRYNYEYDTDELIKRIEGSTGLANMTADKYRINFVGVGIKYEYGNTIKGYVNPFFGYSKMIYPKSKLIVSSEYFGVLEAKQKEAADTQFMYGVNFGAKYRLSKLFSLALNFEYAAVKNYELKVDGETTTYQYQNDSYFYNKFESKRKLPFATFNATIQLGFNF